MSKKIKVLIVDDSAVVRKALTDILSSDASIEVIGAASDPLVAVNKMSQQAPDVVTLDIEMPRMNGLSFLKKIMSQHPLPVVMCSSFVEDGSDVFIKAMEYGATDIILKPELKTEAQIAEAKIRLCDAIKAASLTKPKKLVKTINRVKQVAQRNDADVILKRNALTGFSKKTHNIIVIGASTGGTQALTELLSTLPYDSPGIVIVQHMPKGFTRSFADRLDTLCQVTVKEACDGDIIKQGQVLIAPGDKHILCKRKLDQYFVEVTGGALVSRHRPSVDVLFRSAANCAGRNAVGVILTGMGNDGAQGMKEMHDAASKTIAQDEASSVVFGMPKEAIQLGGVDYTLPLNQITAKLLSIIK